MPTRRSLLQAAGALAATGGAPALARPPVSRFVRAQGTAMMLGDRRYRFVGANMWYAAWLGADAPLGDPDRLRRELDALAALGVTQLRILASAERSPLKNSVRPAFHGQDGVPDPALLHGLDVAMAEIGKRGMRATLYLTNFWEWSGGMMTYLSWTNGGHYIDNGDPAHPWPEFADVTSGFYSTPAAVKLYHDWVRTIVTRRNAVTGLRYADDPAILAWQLANEPRPGGGPEVGRRNMPAFLRWVSGTAGLIKSLDPHHMVCTGSEGLKGCLEDEGVLLDEHRIAGIDYLTAHVWPLNWSWVDDHDLAGTDAAGAAKVDAYLADHVRLATSLRKPLVIEEFGYPRDAGYDPGTSTRWKDAFYRRIYAAVEASAAAGGPVAGSSFWAWSGEGRSAGADHRWHAGAGAGAWLGDPPHEPQGWYGVFDTDTGTKAAIAAHAAALAEVSARRI